MTTGPGDQRPDGDDDLRGPSGPGGDQYGGGQYEGGQYGSEQYGAAPYGSPEYGSPGPGATEQGAPDYGAQPYGSQPYGSQEYGAPGYGASSGYGNAYPPPPPPGGYQSYPTDAGGNQMSGGGAPASLLPRFGARFIDGLIIAIPQQIILAIVAAAFGVSTGTLDTLGASIGYWAVTSVIAVIFAGIWVWYYVWFETHKGQTLGKQLLHLRVLGVRGGNPTLQESLRRNGYIVLGSAATVIGIIPFIGWILQFLIGIAVLVFVIVIAVSINSSPTKQGKHDEMAGGTQVVTTQ